MRASISPAFSQRDISFCATKVYFYAGRSRSKARSRNIGIGKSMDASPVSPIPPTQPPKIYRAMKREPADGLPVVGSNGSSELGARPGVDITVDPAGNVVLDESGMSVAPTWRNLDFTRIPKRLRSVVPGAAGPNSTACFTMGVGTFQRNAVANGLELIPDREPVPVSHGVVAPVQVVPMAEYQSDLANTRAAWQIDET